MKRWIAIILILLVALLAACGPAATSTLPSPRTNPISQEKAIAPGLPVPSPAPPPQIIAAGRGGVSSAAPALPTTVSDTASLKAATDPMIVRTGSMSLVVEDVAAAIEQISTMASSYKGNVVSSNVWQDRERLYGSISIRVPADRFQDAIKALRALAADVTNETTNSQDVTQEYVDLTSQLTNLQATEQQLLKILAKAETVKDILEVQRELTNTRGQIEQIKGRMLYLERTSATSLINVNLQQSKLNLDFNANKTVVKDGEETWFAADIAGGFPPYSYQWELGDKTTSTEAAFTHAYKSAGKYTVSLTVTDDHGNKITKTRTDYITVIPGWSAGNIASSASNGLSSFGRGLASFLIWLGIFSPVWIVAGGIAYGVFWYRRRKKAK